MSRRGLLTAGAAIVVVGLVLLLLPTGKSGASSLSAGPRGWLAARPVRAQDGGATPLLDVPLDLVDEATGATGAGGVWVLTFPWPRGAGQDQLDALQGHLRRGGTVLYAYTRSPSPFVEDRVVAALGLEARILRDQPPLAPWRWWSYQRSVWPLEPGDAWAGDRPPPRLELPPHEQVPRAPEGAEVLYRTADGVPVVFQASYLGGRVVALPAAVFANGRLLAAGHGDLLATLRRELGDVWAFVEYPHGLVDADFAAAEPSRLGWDLFMLHLVVFYVLGLVALGRRFGPVWREPPVTTGTTAAFLENLGALHRELGHHGEAARQLVDRARRLDSSVPEIEVPENLDDERFLELATEVARHGRRRS